LLAAACPHKKSPIVAVLLLLFDGRFMFERAQFFASYSQLQHDAVLAAAA
jgi:hypothetical protein